MLTITNVEELDLMSFSGLEYFQENPYRMENYFEGSYRRRPEQNLAGASRNRVCAAELISKVQEERQKRVEARKLLEKAIVIQSYYRGYVCRKHWKEFFKKEIYTKIDLIKQDVTRFSINDFYYLVQRTSIVYPKSWTFRSKPIPIDDIDKVVYISMLFKNILSEVIDVMNIDKFWTWRVIHFLTLNLRLTSSLLPGQEHYALNVSNVLVSFLDMRLYSHICDPRPILTLVWGELLDRGDLLNRLIKPISNKLYKHREYDDFLLYVNDLIKHLVYFINSCDDNEFRDSALGVIGSSIMQPILNDAVSRSLLPTLRSIDLPLAELASVYLNAGKENKTAESLFRFLYLDKNQRGISLEKQKVYFKLLSELLIQLCSLRQLGDIVDEDSDYDMPNIEVVSPDPSFMLRKSLKLLNTSSRIEMWISYLNVIIESNDNESLMTFCKCLYLLWMTQQLSIYTHRLIKRIAFHPGFLKALWRCILSEKREDPSFGTGRNLYVWNMLAHGIMIYPQEADTIVPALTLFCFFLKHQLSILNDDFFNTELKECPDFFQFTLKEIIEITCIIKDITGGVISLAYPTCSFYEYDRIEFHSPTALVHYNCLVWRSLLEELVSLIRLIYIRDSHYHFITKGFWIVVEQAMFMYLKEPAKLFEEFDKTIPFSAEPSKQKKDKKGKKQRHDTYERTFPDYGGFNQSSQNNKRPSDFFNDRFLPTLRYLPFLVCFFKRIGIFHRLIQELKYQYQNPTIHIFHANYAVVRIRRNYIYEDAFNRLNADAVAECRMHVKVVFKSPLGIDEPGIDGGGLFREFIVELLKTAFDPNRGFFLMNRDNQLYPNPKIEYIEKDYLRHYLFIGRMLGKAIFEQILVEIPLAEFFLAMMVGNKFELHLNGLASLDPDLYRNLMSILTYTGDFADLGLDFTLSVDYFGSGKTVELKPNGSNIQVTKDNVFEYIHLVARYKTQEQISRQTQAFVEGLTSVIPQSWLCMFSSQELQLIISGNESPIDIADLRESAVYSGGYSDDHPTIEIFWRVLSSFNNCQRGQLLKFVTSCSRPPLLGFKELYPPFCIQFVANDTMLPSASTCMNILKLPNFQDEETMRQKILYAIDSGAGFEMI